MSDFDVPDAGGVVFYIRNYEKFYGEDEYFAHHVLDILADHSRKNLLFGKRLMILLLVEQFPHKISTQVVGGFTPMSNLKTGDWRPEIPVFSAKKATPEELEAFLRNLKNKS